MCALLLPLSALGSVSATGASAEDPTIRVRVDDTVAIRARGSSAIVRAAVLCTGDLHEAYVGVTDPSNGESLAAQEIYVRSEQCTGEWVPFTTALPLARPLTPGTPIEPGFSVIVCTEFCWDEGRTVDGVAAVTDRWDRPSVRFKRAHATVGSRTASATGAPGVVLRWSCPVGFHVQHGITSSQRLNSATVQQTSIAGGSLRCDGEPHRRFFSDLYRGAVVPGPAFVIADVLLCTSPDMAECRRRQATRLVTFDVDAAPDDAGEWGARTTRASTSTSEVAADAHSYGQAVNRDGRYVAFQSAATNLVRRDTNRATDIFVRDRIEGTTRRVSVTTSGAQANGASHEPAISANGRYVAFLSGATNLTSTRPGSPYAQLYVRDRVAGVTELVTSAPDGEAADLPSSHPSLSADGRYVAFVSGATNLVPGDANGVADVFVRDRVTRRTHLVSVSTAGRAADDSSYAAAISADGRFVAFASWASSLVPDDTNSSGDVFVHTLASATTRRVSISSDGRQAQSESYNPDISGNGRYVTFTAYEDRLADGDINHHGDVLVRDRWERTTRVASLTTDGRQGNSNSAYGSISDNGRLISFFSSASNLVPDDRNNLDDYFAHSLVTGVTGRVSVARNGAGANAPPHSGSGLAPAVSGDGRHVAFSSEATNLVAGDDGGYADVFIRSQAPARGP